MKPFNLNNGRTIPPIGFGLWKVKDRDTCIASINIALAAGYRHFDTAQAYDNESFVGEAVAASSVPRSDLFITTKISVENITLGRVTTSFEKSLKQLHTDYADLLLLHFPVTLRRGAAWSKLEEIQKAGGAKSIGVSNYTIRHLEELLAKCSIPPAVNQVELHVYLQQPELLEFCNKHNIIVEAYSPLAHGQGLDNPVLTEIAAKHHKTPGQIMIRWCLEAGTVPLPKSVTPERIKSNIDVFDFSLDADDMSKLASLDSDQRTCWDPTHVV
jgi:diketogulonate reductase-like aldo/keto reductase